MYTLCQYANVRKSLSFMIMSLSRMIVPPKNINKTRTSAALQPCPTSGHVGTVDKVIEKQVIEQKWQRKKMLYSISLYTLSFFWGLMPRRKGGSDLPRPLNLFVGHELNCENVFVRQKNPHTKFAAAGVLGDTPGNFCVSCQIAQRPQSNCAVFCGLVPGGCRTGSFHA